MEWLRRIFGIGSSLKQQKTTKKTNKKALAKTGMQQDGNVIATLDRMPEQGLRMVRDFPSTAGTTRVQVPLHTQDIHVLKGLPDILQKLITDNLGKMREQFKDTFESIYEELRSSIQGLKRSHDKELKNMRAQVEALSSQVKAIREAQQKVQETPSIELFVDHLTNLKDQFDGTIERIYEELSDTNNDLKLQDEELKTIRKQVKALSTQLKTISETQKKVQDPLNLQTIAHEVITENLAMLQDQTEDSIRSLSEKLNGNTIEMRLQHDELKTIRDQVKELSAQVKAVNEAQQRAQETPNIQLVTDNLTNLKDQFDGTIERVYKELNDSINELRWSQDETFVTLTDQMESLSTQAKAVNQIKQESNNVQLHNISIRNYAGGKKASQKVKVEATAQPQKREVGVPQFQYLASSWPVPSKQVLYPLVEEDNEADEDLTEKQHKQVKVGKPELKRQNITSMEALRKKMEDKWDKEMKRKREEMMIADNLADLPDQFHDSTNRLPEELSDNIEALSPGPAASEAAITLAQEGDEVDEELTEKQHKQVKVGKPALKRQNITSMEALRNVMKEKWIMCREMEEEKRKQMEERETFAELEAEMKRNQKELKRMRAVHCVVKGSAQSRI